MSSKTIDQKKIPALLSMLVQNYYLDGGSTMARPALDNAVQRAFLPIHHNKIWRNAGEVGEDPLNNPGFNRAFYEKPQVSRLLRGENLTQVHQYFTYTLGEMCAISANIKKQPVQQAYSLIYHLQAANCEGSEAIRYTIRTMFEHLELGELLSEEEVVTHLPDILLLAQRHHESCRAKS